MGAMTAMPFQKFKEWLKAGDTNKPVAYGPQGPTQGTQRQQETEPEKFATVRRQFIEWTADKGVNLTEAEIGQATMLALEGNDFAAALFVVAKDALVAAEAQAAALDDPSKSPAAAQFGPRQQRQKLSASLLAASAIIVPRRPSGNGDGIKAINDPETAHPSHVVAPIIQSRALIALADTIFSMTGNRVEIDVLNKPLVEGNIFGNSVGGSLIQVALASQAKVAWTLHHEAFHAIRTFGLIRPAEYSALERRSAAEGWEQRYKVDTRYWHHRAQVRTEEAIAEGFADYMQKRRPAPSAGRERL